ncbi:citronellyl-CoA dehydrogenase [Panacagrimonas perspica]|uniref:Citronellyl-CoA dehydrogenase n=1 Tax=Panacagrimonas perspica TaxID=381431 RepID=A0A4V6Q483_9GAMM|nr:acyl-CoA dehydrogenase family protein [Panacagrimonas perspica]TDU26596.1 citronellyl-CoA dehydrogenase [Panacagrimonas perspica]THD03960.1 acyl-CoA dehydrogenase [Panacagrimonas perspica]
MILSHEHKELYRTVKKFVQDEINPHVAEWERDGIWPAHKVLKKMGGLGLLGINKPESVGGQGLDYSFQMILAQALGNCLCGGVPMGIGVVTDMATPALARFGSPALQAEYLAPVVAGDMCCSIAVSEAGAGSDVASIKTSARKEGGDYVINGSKMWITNGTQSDWACMLVNTGEGKVHANKSLIVVPLDAKGIDRKTKLDKLGMRCSDTAMIFLDEVRVPQRNLIGKEGMGFTYQMIQFQEERLFGAANSIDGLFNIIDETVEYTRQRQAFGQSVLDNQSVHFRLAELRAEVECLRALTYQACEEYVAGRDATMLASIAKLKAGRVAREVTDGCLQYWGGQGYMWETNVARAYRDTRLVSIGGGADEIMLGIICKLMGTLPSKRKHEANKAAREA